MFSARYNFISFLSSASYLSLAFVLKLCYNRGVRQAWVEKPRPDVVAGGLPALVVGVLHLDSFVACLF